MGFAENILNIVSPVTGAAVTAAQTNSNFDQTVITGSPSSWGYSNIIGTIILFIAMFLAFKCKAPGGGIDPIQIFAAFCCSPCYMVYRLAVPCS